MVTVFGFAGITAPVAILLLVIALIVFGPGKLPDIGKALGRGIKEFKSATDSAGSSDTEVSDAATTAVVKDDKADKTEI